MACKYSSARCAASSFALSSTRWKVAARESDSRTTRGKWRKKVSKVATAATISAMVRVWRCCWRYAKTVRG
eukprot:404511-Pleurochrysis_carterae.AAC.1